MYVFLFILGGIYILMGNDCLLEMGFKLNVGNNVYISLLLDIWDEIKCLFDVLVVGGIIIMFF